MNETKKKVVLITGSGRGIGRGIAVQLARAGWVIGINDFGNPEPPNQTLEMVKSRGKRWRGAACGYYQGR